MAWLAIIWPTLALYSGLGAIWRPEKAGLADRGMVLALAMGLGLGCTSATWYLWLHFIGNPGGLYFALETAIAGLLLVSTWQTRWMWPTHRSAPEFPEPAGLQTLTRSLLIALTLLVISSGLYVGFHSARYPDGTWDALAMWNLHARVLYFGPEEWRGYFENGAVCAYHADYPLLIPSSLARLWQAQGAASSSQQMVVAGWFLFATVLLASSTVAKHRGPLAGLLVAITLLGTRGLLSLSAAQYADLPLAFFLLAALVCAWKGCGPAAGDEVSEAMPATPAKLWSWRPGLILAGTCIGLAAWTKNEGVLFTVAFAMGLIAVTVRYQAWRELPRVAWWCGLGLAPLVLVLAAFKCGIAPSNDLVGGQGGSTLARLLDPTRYGTLLTLGIYMCWDACKVIWIGLLAYVVAVGCGRRTPAVQHWCWLSGAVLSCIAAGFIVVYLTTPHNLEWHLKTSADRLVLQIYPSLICLFFLVVRTPSEWLISRGTMQGTARVATPRHLTRRARKSSSQSLAGSSHP